MEMTSSDDEQNIYHFPDKKVMDFKPISSSQDIQHFPRYKVISSESSNEESQPLSWFYEGLKRKRISSQKALVNPLLSLIPSDSPCGNENSKSEIQQGPLSQVISKPGHSFSQSRQEAS